jgi:hypothetical protein
VLKLLSTTPWIHMGEWRCSSTIFYLATRWRWLFSFMPRPIYPRGKSPWHPFNRKLCGLQSRSGHYGGKKTLVLAGNRTTVIHPVAMPTDLSRVSLHPMPEPPLLCLGDMVCFSISNLLYNSWHFKEAISKNCSHVINKAWKWGLESSSKVLLHLRAKTPCILARVISEFYMLKQVAQCE